ncbi:hypothetical protein ACA910_005817 [Epithemia clementina (nom. ined.)]
MPPMTPSLPVRDNNNNNDEDEDKTSTATNNRRCDQEQRQLEIAAITAKLDPNAVIRSRCHCKSLELTVPIHAVLPLEQHFPPPSHPKETKDENNISSIQNSDSCFLYKAAVDCHCEFCRKYHVVSFCSYLLAVSEFVQIVDPTHTLKTFQDSCHELGSVERLQCGICQCKLATRPLATKNASRYGGQHQLLLNMGPIDDETLPKPMADYFQHNRQSWQLEQRPGWTLARALAEDCSEEGREDDERPTTIGSLTGSCRCGQYKYRIRLEEGQTMELQHCYCKLCRQVSGGPFQTWIPVDRDKFEWVSAANNNHHHHDEPPMQRYVPFAHRHVCENCGSMLTILYDDSDQIHPAAGGLDDDSFQGKTIDEIGHYLHDMYHISCRYQQSWYAIPDDGLEQYPEPCNDEDDDDEEEEDDDDDEEGDDDDDEEDES